jgi:hypothetical protein
MKRILLIILTITTLKVAGQSQFIGVIGGVNLTNTTSDFFLNQPDSRTGLTAGLTYEYLLKKHFSVGADLIYNQRGFSEEYIILEYFGNPTIGKITETYNYDYVSLPIKTGFNFGTTFYGFTNIGVIPSILVNANKTLSFFDIDGNLTTNYTSDLTNRVSKFDFAGLIEIGGGYKFKRVFWLFTTFSYQHSFTTITNADYIANFKIRHNGMALTIGLRYALTKK